MTSRRAFTLPEVLATLVLVGVILPVAMRGITVAMQSSGNARRIAEASELASMKLTDLALTADPSRFTASGAFDAEWSDYRFDSSYTAGQFGEYVLTVNVYWAEQSVERSVSISTIVFIAGNTVAGSEATS
jgi:prepilin-type N-terminal cleavage/methylation domain-containing protein